MTAPQSTTAAPPPRERRRTPVGAVVLIIAGAVICLIALAPLIGGAFLVWANATQRDSDGFFTTPPGRFETTTYAITSDEIDLGADDEIPFDLGNVATVRLHVESGGEKRTFVGIASRPDADRFLSGVARAEVDDLRFDPFSVSYNYRDGSPPPSRPDETDIWVASAEGADAQTIEWPIEQGRWVVVVMNADRTSGVSALVSAGVKVPWVVPAAIGLLGGGLLGLVLGAVLLVVGIVALARGDHIELGGPEVVGDRPVRLEAALTEPPSRWLWLVKWLLLIPHYIVLAVLWLAFSVVSVIAFFAILFTARYPRSLFDFNVGVLRWTWRVGYYGYSALGTDRYPPFSLGHAPDYPATFEVAYPERLSRGLVLVKWWLLAIPLYIVLGIILGGSTVGYNETWDTYTVGTGLLSILVLFAAFVLLFTGRYPRGLFDFVMGLNRFVFRAAVYVALLRDEYPPIRLDQGGAEPPLPDTGPLTGEQAPVAAAPVPPPAPPAPPPAPPAPPPAPPAAPD